MEYNRISKILNKIKKPFVLILVGPPLSGKDTFLSGINLPNTIVISRDQIVLDLWGTDDYYEAFRNVDQKEVDKQLIRNLDDASKGEFNVVINMTNMTSKRRKWNLSFFDKKWTKVALIFPILDNEEYSRRNLKRQEEENKFIPQHVLNSMISSYQTIGEDEGFDRILSL